MRKSKKVLALGMTAVVLAGLTACTSNEPAETSAPSTEPQTEAPSTEAPTPVGTVVEEGKGIDFEDGNFGFVAMNTILAGAAEAEVSLVDFNGSKAVKVVLPDKAVPVDGSGVSTEAPAAVPYIAIDAKSLLGDKISSVKYVSMDMSVDYGSDAFGAVSGSIYAGNKSTSETTSWSVYLDTATTKTVQMEMKKTEFTGEDGEIFMVSMAKVATPATTAPDLYIDNIVFMDADKNPIEIADTSVAFDEKNLGVLDWSHSVKKPAGEVTLAGVAGPQNNNWWPAASNSWAFDETVATAQGCAQIDPALFVPGCVITAYITMDDLQAVKDGGQWQSCCLVFQQLDEIKDADNNVIATYENEKYANGKNPIQMGALLEKEKDADGKEVVGEDGYSVIADTSTVNKSWTIVQWTWDTIVAELGEDWVANTQFMGIADQGAGLKVEKVTVGQQGAGDVTLFNGVAGSSSGWGQAASMNTTQNDGGTLDPAILTPGTVIVVNYLAEEANEEQAYPLEMIAQSWTCPDDCTKWAKVSPYLCTESEAYFKIDDIEAAAGYGPDKFGEYLDAIHIGDCDSKLTVISVGYIPAE